jgi:hypothetical protein
VIKRKLKKTGKMHRLILCFLALIFSFLAHGQSATCSVNKNPVRPGEALKITVSVTGVNGEVQMRQIEGLQFLNGPSVGEQHQTINGKRTSTYSYAYTFRAQKEGTIQIPSIIVITGNKKLKTDPFKIEVSNKQEAKSSDFFLVLDASKRRVNIGEAVVLKYKVYQRYRGFQIEGYDFPELKGFWNEQVKDHQGQWSNVSVNGKNYQVATLKIDVLFPQQSGTFTLENFKMDAVVGNFFNAQKINAISAPLSITVNPLPSGKPDNFVGAFKNLSMKVEPSSLEVKANEAVNIKVTYSGVGNLRLISAPQIKWPEDLEVYDPEISDRITVNSNGMSGKRTFEYVIIPRSEGIYNLPDFKTSYFRLEGQSYAPLSWESQVLSATANEAGADVNYSFNGKTDVQILNQDIRYIQNIPTKINVQGSLFFGSLSFYLIYASPFALFLLSFLALRNQKSKEQDTTGYKQKRAGKNLKKWLNEASKQQNDSSKFYASLQNGLENYLIDKFFMERSKLSRQAIQSRIQAYAGDDLCIEFLTLWDKTEMARFAPMTSSEIPEDLSKANDLLSKIEAIK